ncbi:MAG: hypothetical protein OQK82_08960 [Candidatus Pacearchaeota archaeon]|nr:hypothetical protein [Candidatus Pacearchaeota archaeon]
MCCGNNGMSNDPFSNTNTNTSTTPTNNPSNATSMAGLSPMAIGLAILGTAGGYMFGTKYKKKKRK